MHPAAFDPAAQPFRGEGLVCARGGRTVFGDLAFAVEPGGCLVLAGRNGAGKSSLLRLMAGLHPPDGGRLLWGGDDALAEPEAHRRRLHFLGHLDGVKAGLTVAENLAFWRDAGGRPGVAVGDALAALGLAALADLPARYLSSGQRRRLALARVLTRPAPLWLLDEPTVGLDAPSVAMVARLVAAHRAAGGLAVIATHAPLDLPGATRLVLGGAAPAEPAPA